MVAALGLVRDRGDQERERRIDAIRYYDHWIGMIQKELGISPLPATRAVIEEIRNLHNAENAQHLRVRLMSRDERQRLAH